VFHASRHSLRGRPKLGGGVGPPAAWIAFFIAADRYA